MKNLIKSFKINESVEVKHVNTYKYTSLNYPPADISFIVLLQIRVLPSVIMVGVLTMPHSCLIMYMFYSKKKIKQDSLFCVLCCCWSPIVLFAPLACSASSFEAGSE